MLSISLDIVKQFDTDLEKRRVLSLSAPITGSGSGISRPLDFLLVRYSHLDRVFLTVINHQRSAAAEGLKADS
jgi:hypothetical protein